jgi:hypothetical protein
MTRFPSSWSPTIRSPFLIKEVRAEIKNLNSKKPPGYDLITNQILLPEMGIKYITQLCNEVLESGFFPPQWKIVLIIMIQKPGKSAEFAESYRPIRLLPVLSKLFEKLIFPRISIIMESPGIPDHLLGFQSKHATIDT